MDMQNFNQPSPEDCRRFNSAFCAGLSKQIKRQLCAICRIKRYARGQILRERYWANCVSLILSGLIAEVEPPQASKRPLVLGIASAGDFTGLEAVMDLSKEQAEDEKDSYCLTDCTVAVFSAPDFKALMDSSMELTQHVLQNCLQSGVFERGRMLRWLGYGSAEDSVRYVLHYLRRHGIDYLTHEEIALITNRSRQTVTSILKTITQEEPALFCRP